MTQKELGDYLGVKYNTISGYDSGTNQPNIETILKLATLFECTTDELLGFEGKHSPQISIDWQELVKKLVDEDYTPNKVERVLENDKKIRELLKQLLLND